MMGSVLLRLRACSRRRPAAFTSFAHATITRGALTCPVVASR
jgi:hypothetical protein